LIWKILPVRDISSLSLFLSPNSLFYIPSIPSRKFLSNSNQGSVSSNGRKQHLLLGDALDIRGKRSK
jgi:hypothetical protein